MKALTGKAGIFLTLIIIIMSNSAHGFNPCDDNTLEGSLRCLKLAKQGKHFAQISMARKYASGLGEVNRNLLLAHRWAFIAKSKNPQDIAVGQFLSGLQKSYLSRAQVIESERLAKICMASNYKNCPE